MFVLGSFFNAGNDSAQISDIVDTLAGIERWCGVDVRQRKVWEFRVTAPGVHDTFARRPAQHRVIGIERTARARAILGSRRSLGAAAAEPLEVRDPSLLVGAVAAAVWYFGWLLNPSRIGNPLLYVRSCGGAVQPDPGGRVLVDGLARQARQCRPPLADRVRVDVLVPVCGEPVHVVEPTIAPLAA